MRHALLFSYQLSSCQERPPAAYFGSHMKRWGIKIPT